MSPISKMISWPKTVNGDGVGMLSPENVSIRLIPTSAKILSGPSEQEKARNSKAGKDYLQPVCQNLLNAGIAASVEETAALLNRNRMLRSCRCEVQIAISLLNYSQPIDLAIIAFGAVPNPIRMNMIDGSWIAFINKMEPKMWRSVARTPSESWKEFNWSHKSARKSQRGNFLSLRTLILIWLLARYSL